MNDALNQGFALPPQHPAEGRNPQPTPAALEEWMTTLPLGSPWPLAEAFFDTLHEFNRRQVAYEQRLCFLAFAEQRIMASFDGLPRRFHDVAVPPRRNESERIEQLLLLYGEMALACRCMIDAQDDPATQCRWVAKSLGYLLSVLRLAFIARRSPPRRTWRHTYALFAWTRRFVADMDPALREPLSTAENTFKAMLLLSLSAPQSLRGEDLSALCGILPELAQYGRLCQSSHSVEGAFFLVDLAHDDPPQPKPFTTAPGKGDFLLFDVAGLITEAKRRLRQCRTGKIRCIARSGYDPVLLKKLLDHLGEDRKRQAKRTQARLNVEVVAGMRHAHGFLQSGESPSPPQPEKRPDPRVGISYNLLLNLETVRIEAPAFYRGRRHSQQPPVRAVSTGHRHCATINFSSGGYCLKTEADASFRLQLGGFVIVRETRGGRWLPGSVCWLFSDAESLRFGVRLLAPQLGVGFMIEPEPRDSPDTVIPCLVLPDWHTANGLRLLLPPGSAEPGMPVEVHFGGARRRLVLEQRISQSGDYVEFVCTEPTSPDHLKDDAVDPRADTEILEPDAFTVPLTKDTG